MHILQHGRKFIYLSHTEKKEDMMQSRNFFYSVQAAALSVLLLAAPAFAAEGVPPILLSENAASYNAPNAWFVSVIIFFLLIVLLYSLNTIRNALADSGSWSLSDALSEECEVTDKDGKKITKMGASSSRLVAFMGMIAILLLFIGFGGVALYQFAMTGALGESIDKVVSFLVAGLTLFAPYAVNKFSKLFENIAQPKK
jgi:hypothetical protein